MKYAYVLRHSMLIIMGLVQLLLVWVGVDKHVMGRLRRWLVNEIGKL